MRYTLSILILITMAFSVTAELSEKYRVGSGTDLEVSNINGDITITSIEGNDIIIDIVKKTNKDQTELNKVTVDITSGETFTVATRYLEDNVKVSVDITLQIPAHIVEASIENVNGNIDIEGITADLSVESANGDINIIEVNGTVDIELANGDIRIEGNSVVDDIELANGSIIAELRSVHEDGVQFKLANGTIKIYILEDIDAAIEASMVMGDVKVHDLEIQYSEEKSNSIKGTINEGGPLIEVSTAVGNIHLYRLKD